MLYRTLGYVNRRLGVGYSYSVTAGSGGSDEIMGTPKGPTSAEAFSEFETGLEWFEKQAECCPTQLLLLKRLRDLAAEKSVSAHHQIKIDSFVKKI
ncbi:hypothetical protein QTP88_020510 [Uroleucon formosanum]